MANKVQYVVEVDSKNASRALKILNKGLAEVDSKATKAGKGSKVFAGATNEASAAAQRLASNLGPVGNVLGGMGPKALAAAAAMGGIVYAAHSGAKAYAVQVDAVNKLNNALANQGKYSEATSKGLQQYAADLQKVTTFGDEAIISAQANLATFGMTEQQMRRATQVTLDLAAATGRNLTDASTAVGKAYAGQTDILREMGIEIDKTGTKTEQFEEALAALEGRYSGSAVTAAKSYAGQLEQIGNAAGDAQEAVGKFFMLLGGDVGGGAGSGTIAAFEYISKFFGESLPRGIAEARRVFSEFLAWWLRSLSQALVMMDKLTPDFISRGAPTKIAGQISNFAGHLEKTALEGVWADYGATTKIGADVTNKTPPPSTGGGGRKSGRKAGGKPVMAGPLASQIVGFGEIKQATMAELEQAMFAGARKQRMHATDIDMAQTIRDAEAVGEALIQNQKSTEQIVERTYDWSQGLQNIANMLQSTGGLGGTLGKMLGGAAGVGSMLQGFETRDKEGELVQSGWKGLLGSFKGGAGGIIAGLTGVGSIAGAAVSIGKGLFGLFKKDPVKKAQKEIGKALGEDVSREFAETVMEQAKATGKSLSEVAKELKREADRAAKQAGIDKLFSQQQQRQEGISRAAGSVATWGAAIPASEATGKIWATTFWATVSEVGFPEALKSFQSTFEGMKAYLPEDVKNLFGAMSEEGSPLMSAAEGARALADNLAGLASAGYLTTDAFTAFGQSAQDAYAQALGVTNDEKTALLAIAPLLGNINRLHTESGLALDENTKALIEQAKAAGIAFPIDPMLRMVEVLEAIAIQMGAIQAGAQGAGSAISNMTPPNMQGWQPSQYGPPPGIPGYTAAKGFGPKRLRKNTLIHAHAGELAMVLPKDMAYKHAAKGLYDMADPIDWTKGGGGYPAPTPPAPTVPDPVVVTKVASEAAAQATVAALAPIIKQAIKDEAGPTQEIAYAPQLEVKLDPMMANQTLDEAVDKLGAKLTRALELDKNGLRTRMRDALRVS